MAVRFGSTAKYWCKVFFANLDAPMGNGAGCSKRCWMLVQSLVHHCPYRISVVIALRKSKWPSTSKTDFFDVWLVLIVVLKTCVHICQHQSVNTWRLQVRKRFNATATADVINDEHKPIYLYSIQQTTPHKQDKYNKKKRRQPQISYDHHHMVVSLSL